MDIRFVPHWLVPGRHHGRRSGVAAACACPNTPVESFATSDSPRRSLEWAARRLFAYFKHLWRRSCVRLLPQRPSSLLLRSEPARKRRSAHILPPAPPTLPPGLWISPRRRCCRTIPTGSLTIRLCRRWDRPPIPVRASLDTPRDRAPQQLTSTEVRQIDSGVLRAIPNRRGS